MSIHHRIILLFAVLMPSLVLVISGDEAVAQSSAVDRSELKIADADSDGVVTTEEMKTFLIERYIDAWVEKVDANRNGKISKWEFRLARKALSRLLEEESEMIASMNEAAEKTPSTTIERMNARFEVTKPHLGSVVEDLTAFDESGAEVNFNTFRGKHVVIVFGCLT